MRKKEKIGGRVRVLQIYLIGYRASGKTTVGRELAKRLGYRFIDTDEKIIRESRIEISDMVKNYGWDFFREKEKNFIASINPSDKLIIATGGGAVLNPENIRIMKQNGTVILLDASPAVIKERLSKDYKTEKLRPSISNYGVIAEVDEILAKRNRIYREACDFSVNTDNKRVDLICREICMYLLPTAKEESKKS